MEELIATLFMSREFAHRRHLLVTGPGSYAAHVALNSFYDDIIDNAAPVSAVLTLPAVSEVDFLVAWRGDDGPDGTPSTVTVKV